VNTMKDRIKNYSLIINLKKKFYTFLIIYYELENAGTLKSAHSAPNTQFGNLLNYILFINIVCTNYKPLSIMK